jgi:RNA polymerase sigma-70 factor (ECF subfamily)
MLEGVVRSTCATQAVAVGGNRWSVRSLYEGYSRNVFGRARALLGTDEAAKDAMQEVFLRVLHGDGRVLNEAEPMAWLYRVTTNLCLNKLRDEKRRAELLAQNPANDVDQRSAELRATVGNILRRVPLELQEIAVYYHVDEMTRDEIADLTGVSRRTIGNRLVAFQTVVGTVVGREGTS